MISRRPRSTREMLRGVAGVTLLELVVALSLLAVTLGAIYAFIGTGNRSARATNAFLQSQAQVRAALDNVLDEIRWGQNVAAAAGTSVTVFIPQNTPFSAGSPYTVTFTYNAGTDTITRQEDPDAGGPLPASAAETLVYYVVREDGSNGMVLEYFDSQGVSLGSAPADLTAIVRVRLTITTTTDQTSRTFAGDAALRAR